MFTKERIESAKCLSKKERDWMDKHFDFSDFGYTGPFGIDDTTEHEINEEDINDNM